MLEDLLVLDAPAIELRRNRGGEIIGLDVVDGATIKLLFDETGRRPRPPAPAYEQVIHGRPWKLLTSDELLYLPRNPRPHKAYGFSPVEQIVMTVNIALRRQAMQLQHFTEGNVPPGLLNCAGRLERRTDPAVPGMVRQRPRGQYRGALAPRLGAERNGLSGLQGSAVQGRVRRVAGAHRVLRLLAAADRLYPPGQPRHRRDRAGRRRWPRGWRR